MSVYRVKLGDQIVEVDGVAGLVELVQQQRLGPEDPVFVPASGKWHYARSIRQLREHFPEAPAKPEPPRPPEPDEPVEPAGAQVLNLRRGRWTPDGKGVEVPVFAYDIDADPPAPLRLGLIALVGLLVLALAWTWIFGYRRYVETVTASFPESSPVAVDTAAPRPTPRSPGSKNAGATTTRAAIAPAASPTPRSSPTPPPLPSFDAAAMRRKIAAAGLVPVSRPDQLGAAMRTDLTRLAVPVHEAALTAMKGARDAAVPFSLRVDYAPAEKTDASTMAKQRYAIVAMSGRRIAELHLHVQSFHLRTISGKKVLSDVEIPVDLAARAWQGSASGDDVSARFAGK